MYLEDTSLIRRLIAAERYVTPEHFRTQCDKRRITVADWKFAISNGRLEAPPEQDSLARGLKYAILGRDIDGRLLRVVVALPPASHEVHEPPVVVVTMVTAVRPPAPRRIR